MAIIQSDVRVLVVDGNAHIRRLVTTLLGALAIKVVDEARNPAAAEDMMRKNAPDLVIVDWTGDPTDVVLFVHRIRRGELIDPRTPVLALAASTHHAVLERAWEAGIDDVIAKPISAIEIIQRSASLLAERQAGEYLAEQAAE